MIIYIGDKYTPNKDIVTAKIIFNSIISIKLAEFLDIGLKDFYLGTPMSRPKYMLIPLKMITDEMIKEYNLPLLARNNMALAKINRGM